MEWLGYIFLCLGCVFFIVTVIGVYRMPDVYCKVHPAAVGDTLGIICILLGALCLHDLGLVFSWKLLFIIVFFFISVPTATHALVKAVFLVGKNTVENKHYD